jgi:hypothetical protein
MASQAVSLLVGFGDCIPHQSASIPLDPLPSHLLPSLAPSLAFMKGLSEAIEKMLNNFLQLFITNLIFLTFQQEIPFLIESSDN